VIRRPSCGLRRVLRSLVRAGALAVALGSAHGEAIYLATDVPTADLGPPFLMPCLDYS